MSNNKQIKIGAILSYFSIALNVIAGLIYTPWMIEQIGQDDYGLYTLANSLITLFLVDFGLGSATSRYVSKYRAEGRQDKIDSFLGAVYKLYLIIDAIIFTALVVVYFLLDRIYVKLNPEELEKFKVIYIMAASFAVVNFPFVTYNGILNAYEKFIQLKFADVLYRVSLIVLTVAALLLGRGVYGLVLVHAMVGLITIAYKFIVIKKLPIRVNFQSKDFRIYKDLFGFSIWVTVATLAQRLVFNITPSILGAVASSGAIAVFGIVTTIEGYTYTITSALNGMFMPRISRIYQEGNAERNIFPLFLTVGKFQFALNGLIVAGFAVLGMHFIDLWMGSEYRAAYYGILLVTIPGMFYNSLEVANTAMVYQKRVKLQAYIGIAVGLLNVMLSIALSSIWGAVGACLSIFAAYTFRAVAYNVVCWKVMGFDMPRFARKCYLRMSIPVILTIVFGIFLNCAVPDIGWRMFALKCMAVAVFYCVMIFTVGLENMERKSCIAFLKARQQRR